MKRDELFQVISGLWRGHAAMKWVDVEAYEDRGRADGGQFVIVLRGVEKAPASPRFQLRLPGAERLDPESVSRLEGEHIPLSARVTGDGLVLSVSPHLSGCTALMPGTVVEITMADAGLRGEFIWPERVPLSRLRRRTIMTRPGARHQGGASASSHAPRDEPLPSPLAVATAVSSAAAPVAAVPAQAAASAIPVRTMTKGLAGGGAAAVACALLVAAQLVALRFSDYTIERRQLPSSLPAVVAADSAALPAPQAAESQPSLYDVFVAGPRSPRGIVAGEGISPARALQLAQILLHGPEAGRDPEEAIFWLKQYIGATAGAEHARVAMTQLGSAYAEPISGQRDFASARIAWELASALGDPVAMCFLGAMHEHGISVPMATELASTWYQRATAAGGNCASGPAASERESKP